MQCGAGPRAAWASPSVSFQESHQPFSPASPYFSDFACLFICIWILTLKYLFGSLQWEPRTVITSYNILCISLSLWWIGGGWVSYPTRWSLLFIFGFSNGSSIYISSPSKQQRNIVQLCTRGGWAQLVAGSILVTDEVITFYLNSQVSNYKRFYL